MPRRTLLMAAITAAVAIAAPAAAEAATIERDPNMHELLFRGSPDETNLVQVDGSHQLVISDLNAPIRLKGVPNCKRIDPRSVRCFLVRRLALDLNDGTDVATIATPRDVWISGGAGNDRYNALATEGRSRVDFSGGFGIDVANYFYATEGVHVAVDGSLGSGRPGDLDRIGRTVEHVYGSQFDDILEGASRDQDLRGGEGDDEIVGGQGEDTLVGGPGADRIDALDGESDAIDCGGQLLDSLLADPAGELSVVGCATA